MKYRDEAGVAVKFFRVSRWCFDHHLEVVSKIVFRFMQIVLGCTIPYTVKMGKNCAIAHFHGIVIHHTCVIGDNTLIYQNVTLGGRNGESGPVIGKNVVIGAGACVLGSITIGDNVKIGANAVVLESVPSDCTVVGVPAKIVKKKKKI